MFEKSTVKLFSVIACILSVTGLLISIIGVVAFNQQFSALAFGMGVVTWGLLFWSSIIAYQLSSKYALDADEYKKVGIRVYIIIAAFILFLVVGLVAGLILSVYVLSGLWGMKKNYDEWATDQPPMIDEHNNLVQPDDSQAGK
jgi:hypothetical protein